jgi:hypothetical protein
MRVLFKCLFFRLLAGLAMGVAIFGFWRAVNAPMPWPFLRLCVGTLLGVAVFRFFWVRSSLLRSFLLPTASDAAAQAPASGWLYGAVSVAGLAAVAMVAI